VVVNQALLEKLNITGDPIGQTFYKQRAPATIVGVCGDFETVWSGLQPIVLTANEPLLTGTLTVRVSEINNNIIETVKEKMGHCYQNTIAPEVSIFSESIFKEFRGVRMFRDQVIIASVFLLLITIMGILGYVNMEMRRRTKEVAIRKIHGSTAAAIIWEISRGLLLIALLASAVAIPLAYMTGGYWQQEFPVKASLSWYLFAGAALIVVITIALCTVIQTWRTANANPARTIMAE
jgi:putative ABC transport system permease protein